MAYLFDIINGPSKWSLVQEFFGSCHHSKQFVFYIKEQKVPNGKETISKVSILIHEIGREDESGENFSFAGTLIPVRGDSFPVRGSYSTQTRKGTLERKFTS